VRRSETLAPVLRHLLIAAACIPIGAMAGFLTIAIFSLVAPAIRGPRPEWAVGLQVLQTAAWVGGKLGAIFLPLAYLTLLRKADLPTAIPSLIIATVVAAIIGYLIADTGGAAMLGLGAFLMTCIAMWRRHALGMKSTTDTWWIDRP